MICVSDAETEKKTENAKDKQENVVWSLRSAEINITDKDLTETHTIIELGNPEFFCGNINAPKMKHVSVAVTQAAVCKGMCEKWANHVKGNPVDEEMLDWLKKELDSAVKTMVNPKKQALKEGIELPKEKKKALKADQKASTGKTKPKNASTLNRLFPCCGGGEESSDSDTEGNVELRVKFLSGSTINVSMDGTVGELKKKIQILKRIHPDHQTLFQNGKQLEDGQRLEAGTIFVAQRRAVMGIPTNVKFGISSNLNKGTVESDSTAGTKAIKSAQILDFSPNEFKGLYKWYSEGQDQPDEYCGELCDGKLRNDLSSYLQREKLSNQLCFFLSFSGQFDGVGQIAYGDASYYR